MARRLRSAARAIPGRTTTGTSLPEARVLRADLRDFYEDYAACLDEEDLGRWITFFTDDGVYRVTSRENHAAGLPLCAIECVGMPMIRDRVAAIEATTVYEPRSLRHMVSCLRINRVEGGIIEAQANFAIFECLSDREPHVFMSGLYLDKVRREDAGFRFKERVCVYDNYRIRTSLVLPV
jgi:anthranilate 1,2-dioxygenase small subunit